MKRSNKKKQESIKDIDPDETIVVEIVDKDRWLPLGKALRDARIAEHWVWKDPQELKMWLWMLMEAKQ